jgi:hypothetical protein
LICISANSWPRQSRCAEGEIRVSWSHKSLLSAGVSILTLITAVHAVDAVPKGKTATINVAIDVKQAKSGQFKSSKVERQFKGKCTLEAGPLGAISHRGPTADQQKTFEDSNKKAQKFQDDRQKYGSFEERMMAEADKCGEDEACLEALAERLAKDPEAQEYTDMATKGGKEAERQVSALGPPRYQVWTPKACTGTLRVSETYAYSDSGGEGGVGAYSGTTTVQGEMPVAVWSGVFAETDIQTGTTTYEFPRPVAFGEFVSKDSIKGAGKVHVQLLSPDEKFPTTTGPMPGSLPDGNGKGSAGITFNWKVVR